MAENRPIETASLLTEEDELLLAQIERIKKNILRYVGHEEIISKMREIIKASDVFSFRTSMNEKYISRPLFVLKMDRAKAEKKYGYRFVYREGEESRNRPELEPDYRFISQCVHDEITGEFSDFIARKLKDGDQLRQILKGQGIDADSISDGQLSLVAFVTASVFGIVVELSQNVIYLELAF